MPNGFYDQEYVRRYYDEYGDREWDRLERTPANRVNLHIHSWYLRQYVRPGDHVLDIGAGPGRFTVELAALGARVTVGDVSPVQLELNQHRVEEAGLESSIVARQVLDVVDLSSLRDGRFDATVCYGGALSYVFDQADAALSELLRVTRPGGHVLLSVMSLYGTARRYFSALLDIAGQHGPDVIDRLFRTGDQVEEAVAEGHRFRYYRWAHLEALLRRHRCEIVAASAANFLAIGNNEQLLEPVRENPALWQAYLAWELEAARQPGALDAGTHIIAVVRKT